MCRCCQRCLEDIYWNCFEERFCYDETIANYNPDEDEYIINSKKSNGIIVGFQTNDNNNTPICHQPMRRECSTISSKIHEEDYRREIQTNIPILAPEILSVFATSQIFVDHQPKISRNKTKTNLPSIHGESSDFNEDKLLKKLEGLSDITDNEFSINNEFSNGDKKIKFTISSDSDSPVELRRSMSPNKFSAIIEEENNNKDSIDSDDGSDTFDINKNPVSITSTATNSINLTNTTATTKLAPLAISRIQNNVEKKPLRSVHSVPYFTFRQASENDIFSISGSLGQISMTPEVPSISYSNLPKNYLDTPAIDKYKESVSLYSIQAANKAKALDDDYSMPRYFRMPTIMAAQSTGNLNKDSAMTPNIGDHGKKVEKSKRLKLLRGSLPPLLIHTVRSHKKEEVKNMS